MKISVLSLMRDRRVDAAVGNYDAAFRALKAVLPLPAINSPNYAIAAGQAHTRSKALTRALRAVGKAVSTVSAIRNKAAANKDAATACAQAQIRKKRSTSTNCSKRGKAVRP